MAVPVLILGLAAAQLGAGGPPRAEPAQSGPVQTAPAQTAPAVFLDHLYVVVDSATYEAMAASPFLRDGLARFGERTNRSGAEAWTSLGVGGERTYLEVFRVGDRYPRVGTSGIAFSVGVPGGLDSIAAVLAASPGVTVDRSARTGVMGGREMAWFRSLRVNQGASSGEPSPQAISRWVMEYERPFRVALMGDSADAVSGAELRRWLRARRYDPARQLRDITGVTLALPRDDAAAFRAELEAYGFAVSADAEGYTARGPGVTIRVVASSATPGIRAVRLRLEGGDPGMPEHVFAGGSTLRIVDDTTAVWMFDPGATPPRRPK